ncbi:hypothetical protein [Variovorax sp. EL159]|nr:hypothetical protein [Variovorax sp. EL159]SCX67947.1 hypothetical protein SAMN03159363_3115 [Variovorax sp. EL159]
MTHDRSSRRTEMLLGHLASLGVAAASICGLAALAAMAVHRLLST